LAYTFERKDDSGNVVDYVPWRFLASRLLRAINALDAGSKEGYSKDEISVKDILETE